MSEAMEYDVAIVGCGPAGLAAAIRLKQLKAQLRVCILEKGAAAGVHILSGCVFDPIALNALLPDWREQGAPLTQPALQDKFLFLTRNHAIPLPVPGAMRNSGCYIISLAELCRWLAGRAEALGVDIFPGFAAVDLLIEQEVVRGIKTGEMGRGRDGTLLPNYQPGVEIRAQHTLLAEGCRGSLSEYVMRIYGLRERSSPQTYGIGIKEIWEVPASQPGLVAHSVGWPLDRRTYGGSFIYHMGGGKVAAGFITGLDYENPYLDPYQEFQRFKTHPSVRKTFEGGKRIAYGARALNEGGFQAIPDLTFPGGALIGDAAGFLNVARIKGSHTAMFSGMALAEAIAAGQPGSYMRRMRDSWVARELKTARNLRPGFHYFGLYGGLIHAAIDQFLLRGRAPWTLNTQKPDHVCLKPAAQCRPIHYPKPDGVLTFDRMSSVYLSNTHHAENQPCHLLLADPGIPVGYNLPQFAAPEQRYCPAGVYEIVQEIPSPPAGEGKGGGAGYRLQINAANCVHCKTCDIKDPLQNILWVPPEGGGGPNYGGM